MLASYRQKARAQRGGKWGNSPPPNRKNCCRKMVLFPKTIFSNIFQIKSKNKIKIQYFYRIFINNFQIYLKISQQLGFFVQTREKSTHGLLNFLKHMLNECIFRNYLNFLKISKNCDFCPNAQKFNAWFVTFFEKYAKIMRFRNFLKKFFQNFRKVFPPKKILAMPMHIVTNVH